VPSRTHRSSPTSPLLPSPQDLNRFSFQHRLLLTGTPLQNSLDELFFLMHFLDPGAWRTLEEFNAKYCDLSNKEAVAALHAGEGGSGGWVGGWVGVGKWGGGGGGAWQVGGTGVRTKMYRRRGRRFAALHAG
jgi:hypothetical protein